MQLVKTYNSPSNGHGLWLFKDGALKDYDLHAYGSSTINAAGDGQVVFGRSFVDEDDRYTNVEIDELIFFNEALSDGEVRELYNMYQ